MIGNTSCTDLPPGFRFHPTDEELIMYYLRNQAMSRPCPVSIIPEVDIYKFDPWQLPEKAGFGENEWYFFTPRDRKYPNGVRPNRATASGYWKATGTDKAIYSGSKYVGVKKALVFYKGRPPKGVKTDWIMHEYRLNESKKQTQRQSGSMRLDDWVLCRIYKKKHAGRHVEDQTVENLCTQMDKPNTVTDSVNVSVEPQKLKFPRTCSLSHLLELDYLSPISHILNDNTYQNFDFSSITSNGEIENPGKVQLGEMTDQYTDSGKFQVNQAHFFNNQPLFVNPVVYDFQ